MSNKHLDPRAKQKLNLLPSPCCHPSTNLLKLLKKVLLKLAFQEISPKHKRKMKLLGWMHRKFRQNSGEPLRDFVIGQPPSDDQQQYFPRTNINKPFKQSQRDLNQRKSVSGSEVDSSRADQGYELDDPIVSISEIFPGFLAIGTLGSSDPATPKFSISIDNITERETEVTENELKLINDELEKVLEANDDSGSRRNSHVSMGRTSHGSTVTLSGKVLEGPESNVSVVNGGGAVVCPLQGYLFGSAVELSETTTAIAKKENRTSLGELFQRSKLSEEVGGGRSCDKDDQKQVEKELGDKYGMQLIKKKLKKRMLNAASRSSSTAAGGVFDVSTETKLHKILHMFNRKVYPETTTMGKEKWDHKAQKNDKKKKTAIDGVVYKNNGERTFTDEDIMIFPKKLILKQTLRRNNSQSIPPQFSDDDGDSNWNKEQWIKTDDEYLVLEL